MGQISMEISEPDGSAVGGNQQGPPFIDDGAERAAALFNSRSVNVTVTFPISGEVKFPTFAVRRFRRQGFGQLRVLAGDRGVWDLEGLARSCL